MDFYKIWCQCYANVSTVISHHSVICRSSKLSFTNVHISVYIISFLMYISPIVTHQKQEKGEIC
jgi:hypothetical protein